jgi:hypothetical protein
MVNEEILLLVSSLFLTVSPRALDQQGAGFHSCTLHLLLLHYS